VNTPNVPLSKSSESITTLQGFAVGEALGVRVTVGVAAMPVFVAVAVMGTDVSVAVAVEVGGTTVSVLVGGVPVTVGVAVPAPDAEFTSPFCVGPGASADSLVGAPAIAMLAVSTAMANMARNNKPIRVVPDVDLSILLSGLIFFLLTLLSFPGKLVEVSIRR
jgi:hypothetical protein